MNLIHAARRLVKLGGTHGRKVGGATSEASMILSAPGPRFSRSPPRQHRGGLSQNACGAEEFLMGQCNEHRLPSKMRKRFSIRPATQETGLSGPSHDRDYRRRVCRSVRREPRARWTRKKAFALRQGVRDSDSHRCSVVSRRRVWAERSRLEPNQTPKCVLYHTNVLRLAKISLDVVNSSPNDSMRLQACANPADGIVE